MPQAVPLLQFTTHGIYCAQADIYIDPWHPGFKAIITHAHADHARYGQTQYLAHHDSAPIMRQRLGQDITLQTVAYNEPVHINGVQFSLHPAGHIPGSAQVRVAYKGEVWVASGDYKLHNDGLSTPFEPVRCHRFITESTFGLPVFQWPEPAQVMAQINQWWQENQAAGKVSLLGGYALGKAQRLLCGLDPLLGPIFVHGAIWNVHQALVAHGIELPQVQRVDPALPKKAYENAMVLATPSALSTPWAKRFQPFSTAFASGWMALRGTKRRRAADRGFVLSDHADWQELNTAVKATGAETVYVTHGYSSIFSKWLTDQGLQAIEIDTLFEGEVEE